jgi:ABC-type transporter lipoprotein component MlaA
MIFPPSISTIKKRSRSNKKLKISDKHNRFADSLSVFGRTIASSNLSEDITIIIPIKLTYTEYIPNDSGEKNLLRNGCSNIDIS